MNTVEGSPSSRVPFIKREVLLCLKREVHQLLVISRDSPDLLLTSDKPQVEKFLVCLETCMIFGARSKEFLGVVPLWGYLEMLDTVSSNASIRSVISTITRLQKIRTPLAKARAFLRQCLNSRELDVCLEAMRNHRGISSKYFTNASILSNDNELTILAALVKELHYCNFSLVVDDPVLNQIPPHIQCFFNYGFESEDILDVLGKHIPPKVSHFNSDHSIAFQENPSRRRYSMSEIPDSNHSSANQNHPTGGFLGTLDYMLGALEVGFDKVMGVVDGSKVKGGELGPSQGDKRRRSLGSKSVAFSSAIDSRENTSPSSEENGECKELVAIQKEFMKHQNEEDIDRDAKIDSVYSTIMRTAKRYSVTTLPLFGSSLKELLMDSSRSKFVVLEPRLGIPWQIDEIFSFIESQPHSPELFRKTCDVTSFKLFKSVLEDEITVSPKDYLTHWHPSVTNGMEDAILVATSTLLQWLNDLPDPLFGNDHYDAIFSGFRDIESLEDRLKTISMLILDSPWYCRPLVVRLLTFLQFLLRPENTEWNGLNIVAISVLFTPCLLRPSCNRHAHSPIMTPEDREKWFLSAAASGSGIIEYILANQLVLQNLIQFINEKEDHMISKCQRMERIIEEIPKNWQANLFSDQQDLGVLVRLFNAIKVIEVVRKGENTSVIKASPEKRNEGEIELDAHQYFGHDRWVHCGFDMDNPSKYFEDGPGGLLAVNFLINFFEKYGPKAGSIGSSFVEQRLAYCSISQVSMKIVKILLSHLRLENYKSFLSNDTDDLFASDDETKPERKSNTTNTTNTTRRTPTADNNSTSFSTTTTTTTTTATFTTSDTASSKNSSNNRSSSSNNNNSSKRNSNKNSKMSAFQIRLLTYNEEGSKALGGKMWTVSYSIEKILDVAPFSWSLVTSDSFLQDAFDVALFIFEDCWIYQTEIRLALPSFDTYLHSLADMESILSLVLQECGGCGFSIWEKWTQVRLKHFEAIFTTKLGVLHSLPKVPSQLTIISSNSSDNANRTVGNQALNVDVNNGGGSSGASGTTTTTATTAASFRNLSIMGDRPSIAKQESLSSLIHRSSISGGSSSSSRGLFDVGLSSGDDHNDIPVEISSVPGTSTDSSQRMETNSSSSSELSTRAASTSTAAAAASSSSTTASMSSSSTNSLPTTLMKSTSGIRSHVLGGSNILDSRKIVQLEAALPQSMQCYNWKLCYRLSRDGANISTLTSYTLNPTSNEFYPLDDAIKASSSSSSSTTTSSSVSGASTSSSSFSKKKEEVMISTAEEWRHPGMLLVIQSMQGDVFGVALKDPLVLHDRSSRGDNSRHHHELQRSLSMSTSGYGSLSRYSALKYYGSSDTAVYSFQSGVLEFFPSSLANNYYILVSPDMVAFGGGGDFAICLDSDLNHGTSGYCETFRSPRLCSEDAFLVQEMEVFILSGSYH